MLSVKIKKREDKKEVELEEKLIEEKDNELKEYIENQFDFDVSCRVCKKKIKDISVDDIEYTERGFGYIICPHCKAWRFLSDEQIMSIEYLEEEKYNKEGIYSDKKDDVDYRDYCESCLEDLSEEEELDDYGYGFRICPKCGKYNYSDKSLSGYYD